MLPWNKKISFNYEDMESNLIKNASSEDISDEDKYYQALEEINKAANIFEEAGLVRVSSLLGDVIAKFSKAEELSSKKQVENLKQYGWQFGKPKNLKKKKKREDYNKINDGPGEPNREMLEILADKIENGEELTKDELQQLRAFDSLDGPMEGIEDEDELFEDENN